MLQVARLCNSDLKVLIRWFCSKTPRYETVSRLARALGHPPAAARALCSQLRPEEILHLKFDVEYALSEVYFTAFDDPKAVYDTVKMAFRSMPSHVTQLAYSDYFLGKETTLLEGESPSTRLDTGLAAFERILAQEGYGFLQRLIEIAEVDKDVAAAGFIAMRHALSLSKRDNDRIESILAPYLGNYRWLANVSQSSSEQRATQKQIGIRARAVENLREFISNNGEQTRGQR